MAFSDARNERDRADTGRNSDNHGNAGGGRGAMGGRGTLGQQQDRRNMDAARRAGNAAPGVGANNNRGTLSQMQDRINTNRAVARSNTAPGVGNYSKAMDDYNNVGQGFFDDPFGALGRFFGGGFGVGEIDPSTQAPKSFVGRDTASWGIDPIGAALGVGGMFGGPLGSLASGVYNRGIKGLMGWQGPMIAFDGNQPVTGGFPSIGGNNGGGISPQPGGGTGMANAGGMGAAPQVAGVQGVQSAGLPRAAAAPQQPGLARFGMPGGQMNVPGPSQYGVNLPSYGYFGSPGVQKPKSAIMGGI
jgi:hypothetical protein